MRRFAAALSIALGALTAGCSWESGEAERFHGTVTDGVDEPVSKFAARYGTIVVEGCGLDGWQTAAIQLPHTKRLAKEIILSCPTMRSTGVVDPVDEHALKALKTDINLIRQQGYKVRLAITMGDQFDSPYPGDVSARAFASAEWQAKIITNLAPFADMADGLEMFLLEVPDGIRQDLNALMQRLKFAYGAKTHLGAMVPPSVVEPSDIPGGDAFDLRTISQHVDRIRLMSLDFSCCGAGPGPTIDSGWAVDVVRHNRTLVGSKPLDLSVPLYGVDFSNLGERFVTALEGRALAAQFNITPTREASGVLHIDWVDPAGRRHSTWWDDAVATSRVLNAWDTRTLDPNVGVIYYGLGAEDPRFWENLARGAP
jgi:spore germination protein YaaH